MKWLLISTLGKNVGDDWIRVGIKQLINSVDSNPEYRIVDKEEHKRIEKQPFDRAVWCGMPMFWSVDPDGWSNNLSVPWWDHLLMDWVSAFPRKLLVMGVGTFFGQTIYDYEAVVESLRKLKRRCWKITMRDTLLASEGVECMVCPASFAIRSIEKGLIKNTEPRIKLANLMPSGSHYEHMNRFEAELWKETRLEVGKVLLNAGFEFAAHSHNEINLAKKIGWKSESIHYCDPKDPIGALLPYSRTGMFFGNRMHGAVVARSNSADTRCAGYCSRLDMVRMAGGSTYKPSQINLVELKAWAESPIVLRPFNMELEFNRQRRIIKAFAGIGA